MTCPCRRSTRGAYSASGSQIITSSLVSKKQLAISRFALKDLPEPGVPKIKPLGFFQQLSVHHDEVVGQSIDAIVQSFFPVLEQFLRSKGHKDSCGTGGQSSLNLNLIETQRQTAHQPFFLLEVQPGQLTVILLGNRACLKDVVAKLTGGCPLCSAPKRRPGTFSRFGSANPATAFSLHCRR